MARSLQDQMGKLDTNTPVRDISSLKQLRYGPGHEKYPSWPIPESSVAEIDPGAQFSSLTCTTGYKSKSLMDQTDYEKEDPRMYARPYMTMTSTKHQMNHPSSTESINQRLANDQRSLVESDSSYKLGKSDSSLSIDLADMHQHRGHVANVEYASDLVNCHLDNSNVQKAETVCPIPSPPTRDRYFVQKTITDDWSGYPSKKYASSEGYHSYMSTESVRGASNSTPFLDLLRRENGDFINLSNSYLNEVSCEPVNDSKIHSTSRKSWDKDIVPEKSRPPYYYKASCDEITASDTNLADKNLTFRKDSVLQAKQPMPLSTSDSYRVRRQGSLCSHYRFYEKRSTDGESVSYPNPKLSITKRCVSTNIIKPEVSAGESGSTRYNNNTSDQVPFSAMVSPNVAQRISAFESALRQPKEIVKRKSEMRYEQEAQHDSAQDKNTYAGNSAFNGASNFGEENSSFNIGSANLPAKASYSYLDPQKKLRVNDVTLKAIQKQALLSYYERHTGKPVHAIAPNEQRTRSSTSNSGNQNSGVTGFGGTGLHSTTQASSASDLYPTASTAKIFQMVPERKDPSILSEASCAAHYGVATAIVAPLQLHDPERNSGLKLTSGTNVVPTAMAGQNSNPLIHSPVQTLPPKRPPKKTRPSAPTMANSCPLDAGSSPPPPLPRAPTRPSANPPPEEPLKRAVSFANQTIDRIESPELPLPPPPPMVTGCTLVSDEPLPSPPLSDIVCESAFGKLIIDSPGSAAPLPSFKGTSIEGTRVIHRSSSLTTPNFPELQVSCDKKIAGSRRTESKSPPTGPKSIGATNVVNDPSLVVVQPPSCSCDEILPSNSAYFTTSESKAKLLTQYKAIDSGHLCLTNSVELLKQKEELVSRISCKLEILRTEQLDIREEINSNEQLGRSVNNKVQQKASPKEFAKFSIHMEEVEKITSLLLSLSGRLARAENALMGFPEDSNPKEKAILEGKRDKLKAQLEEAKVLKEGIDHRSAQVSGFLRKYLTSEEYEDYLHFMKMKAKLIIDAREIDEKIKLGEEQMTALQEALAL